MLVQNICFILAPVPLHFSHHITQSSVSLPCIITHILILIQSLEVVKYIIGCLGGTYEESSGDVLPLLKVATHGYHRDMHLLRVFPGVAPDLQPA